MKVKWKTKVNKLPEIQARIKAVNGIAIQVGVLEGEDAWLAGIHEYGCDIPVTEKMRKYLHSQGLHLSPSTKVIHIPERAFLRNGYDSCKDEVIRKAAMLVKDVIDGNMSEEMLFKEVGLTLSDKIKTYARDLSKPENHPFTIERKGSDNPLIDTGEMIDGITWRKA